MTALRVLVCDDEPLAIERLETMLSRVAEVEVVGSASNGGGALDKVAELRPDLLLLDIEMPGMDGFDVVEQLGRTPTPGWDAPLVAFVTAFRRFAPEAFDSGAVDFLSKPVRISRLQLTLERAAQAIAGREAGRRLAELQARLGSLRGEQNAYDGAHVWIQRRGEQVRVLLSDVHRITAEGAYVRLHIGATSYLHRETIGAISAQLDPALFVRVHRSHLVRVDQVSSIRRTLNGGAELVLRDGERIPLGRKYASEARRQLLDPGPRP